MVASLTIGNRVIGPDHPPLICAEVGINHMGNIFKAYRMIDEAAEAGCECVKFQCHIPAEEMLPPPYVSQQFWDLIKKCSLTEKQERDLKEYTEEKGLIYLSTPFSKAAADRLERLGVLAFKVGSGECNNLPLLKYIVSKGKPVILSTGMNSLTFLMKTLGSVSPEHTLYNRLALMHCTSMYPTPYNRVRLGAMLKMVRWYPKVVYGLSDHTPDNYASFAAVAMGASIIEKHFISDKSWESPDVAVSIDPTELKGLIRGTRAVWEARGGSKEFLDEEKPVAEFAFASIITTQDIKAGEPLTPFNIWVKRPGTGIPAREYERVLGEVAVRDIPKDSQLKWEDFR